MTLDDAGLATVLFGGHTLAGLLALTLVLPYFAAIPRRPLLGLAALIAPAGLGYLFVFDLFVSGQFVSAALPALLSAILFAGYAVLAWRDRVLTPRQVLTALAALAITGWAHVMTILFAHPCFMGACV